MFLMQENPRGIANFDALEPRFCTDIKGIMAPEIGPQVSGLLGNRPLDLALTGYSATLKGY